MADTHIFALSGLSVTLTTEPNVRGNRVDEFGVAVDYFRLRTVAIDNKSGSAWSVVVLKDGAEVYSASIAVGLVQTITLATNRRFDFFAYTILFSRSG